MRTTVLIVTLLLLSALFVQADDSQGRPKPVFVLFPDTISTGFPNHAAYQFYVVDWLTRGPRSDTRYFMMSGPGEIDSLTGYWQCVSNEYLPGATATVIVGAFFVDSQWQDAATCTFVLSVDADRPPIMIQPWGYCSDTLIPWQEINFDQPYCRPAYMYVQACDPDGPIVPRYEIVSGPGELDSVYGDWRWQPSFTDIGTTKIIVLRARDTLSSIYTDTVRFAVAVIGDVPPRIYPEGPVMADRISINAIGAVRLSAHTYCDGVTWTLLDDGNPSTVVALTDPNSYSTYVSFLSTTEGEFSETVIASLGGFADTCQVIFRVAENSSYALRIEKKHMVLQGLMYDVEVTLDRQHADLGLGGFNALITYDGDVLALQDILPDSIYSACKWEYFTFRFGVDGDCPPDLCPSHMVRVIGIAETNNGASHPIAGCPTAEQLPIALFSIKFLVSNDRTYECQYTPIRFYWVDCEDNTISSKTGYELFIADRLFDYHDYTNPVDPNSAILPGYAGVPKDHCDYSGPYGRTYLRDIDFYNGGMDIVCNYTIDERGDINLNGFSYEIADEVLFSRYFLYGLPVFTINQAGQIATSDINLDGLTLTIEDFVCLCRVIRGAAQPNDPPPYSSDTVLFTLTNGILSALTDDTLGAVYLTVAGNISPTLFVPNMQMGSNFDGTNTHILIAPPLENPQPENYILAGALLDFDDAAEILSISTATYRGSRIASRFDITSDVDDESGLNLPSTFALHQNYPNPFNAGTIISFDLPRASEVNLEIINILGNVVYRRQAHYAAGSHRIEWDGRTTSGALVASGIYYYRLTAGSSVDTKKMLLLK